ISGGILLCGIIVAGVILRPRSITIVDAGVIAQIKDSAEKILPSPKPQLDKAAYDAKLLQIANLPTPKPAPASSSTAASTSLPAASATSSVPKGPWPVKAAYPNAGAVLPFKRIIAYYGNLYSKQMGALGQYPEEQMLRMLQEEVAKWNAADPATPAIPALHYIAVTAQGSPGQDGTYRFRMPDSEIDKVIAMADKIGALVFLDTQVGASNLQAEIPRLEKYLKLPQVHLGVDPEFSMKSGQKPGTVIGTMDAADINYAASYLAKLVQENDLPPKILMVHRFTQPMLTNAERITPLPEVQIVIDADGL